MPLFRPPDAEDDRTGVERGEPAHPRDPVADPPRSRVVEAAPQMAPATGRRALFHSTAVAALDGPEWAAGMSRPGTRKRMRVGGEGDHPAHEPEHDRQFLDRLGASRERDMEIDKDKILEALRRRGQHQRAEWLDKEMPDRIDTVRNSGLLSMLNLDPAEFADQPTP
ncbi:hypothetical protein [Micromonospora sp. NPDC004704]